MVKTIIDSILIIFIKILSIFEKKEEQKIKATEAANTSETIRKAEIVRDIVIKDKAEKVVSDLNNSTDEKEKEKLLESIRRSVS